MRAAAYIRQSNKYDKEMLSLEVQEEQIRAFAAERGYVLSPQFVFVERHTGVELFERPKLMELLGHMRAGAVDVVLLWSTDRFSREPEHLTYLMVVAKNAHVRLEFVTEQLDDTDEGWLVRQVMGYAAKREWVRKRETTHSGKKKAVEKGKPMLTGLPLYGYVHRSDRRGYLPHAAQAAVVRRIYAAVADGQSFLSLARALNVEGVPTSKTSERFPDKPGTWHPSRLRQLVLNPAYKGQLLGWRWQTTISPRTGGKYTKLRDPGDTIPLPPDACPPLVDPGLWQAAVDRVQSGLAAKNARRNNKYPEASLLRAGYVHCGHCGNAMGADNRIRKSGHMYISYRCISKQRSPLSGCPSHSIAARVLDTAVWGYLTERLADPVFVASRLRAIQADGLDADVTVLADLDLTLADTDKKIMNLSSGLAEVTHDIARAAIVNQLNQLSQQRERLAEERERIQRRQAEWLRARAWLTEVEQAVGHWREHLMSADIDYTFRRNVLTWMGVRVTVWRKACGPLDPTSGEALRWRVECDVSVIAELSCSSSFSNHTPVILVWSDSDERRLARVSYFPLFRAS